MIFRLAALAARAMLIVFLFVNVVAMRSGGTPLMEKASLSVLSGLASGLYLTTYIASGVVGLMWIYAAARNTLAVRPGLAMTPGWAVGCFFVPFANLYKPYRYMRDIWVTASGPTDGVYKATGEPVVEWWIATVLGVGFSFAAARSGDEGAGIWLSVFAAALQVASSLFFISLVQKVTRRQSRGNAGIADQF